MAMTAPYLSSQAGSTSFGWRFQERSGTARCSSFDKGPVAWAQEGKVEVGDSAPPPTGDDGTTWEALRPTPTRGDDMSLGAPVLPHRQQLACTAGARHLQPPEPQRLGLLGQPMPVKRFVFERPEEQLVRPKDHAAETGAMCSAASSR